jgi:hypothetical protein
MNWAITYYSESVQAGILPYRLAFLPVTFDTPTV